MKNTELNLDEYETSLLESIDNEEWEGVSNIEELKFLFQDIAKNTLKQLQTIEIKIEKEDIDAIEKRSNEYGISFDTLIYNLLHSFAKGKINLEFKN